MTQAFEPIETVAGVISGRDAIFLDNVRFDCQKNVIELRGELNSVLCSKYKDAEAAYIQYSLTFSSVLTHMVTELDFRDYLGVSSFDQVANSEWLNDFRKRNYSAKVKPNHKHYMVFTYDDVFDIISERFEMKLLESRAKAKRKK